MYATSLQSTRTLLHSLGITQYKSDVFPVTNKTDDYRAYKAVDVASILSYTTEVRAPKGSECSIIPRLHPVPRQSMKIFSTGYIILRGSFEEHTFT